MSIETILEDFEKQFTNDRFKGFTINGDLMLFGKIKDAKSFLRTSLEEYGREVRENQEEKIRDYLNEYKKVVIDKCIEALPQEQDLTNLTENHEIFEKIGENARGYNNCLKHIRNILNNLK